MRLISTALFVTAMIQMPACSTYRETGGYTDKSDYYIPRAQTSIDRFRQNDPTLDRFFDTAVAYAVFPQVTKGAAGIGAAHGEGGVVFQNGIVVGFAELSQVTVGAQLGGQSYEELIFFKDMESFNKFKNDQMEFSASASAVASTSGSAAASDYSEGVAVFTKPIGGLMFEASIGGQTFDYTAR